jgi:PIN domain nuclease of toxin-antitoxin system
MKGLLDTHAFIWWDSNPRLLSAPALAFLTDPTNTVLLSVASVWEMEIKHQLGKLPLTIPIQTVVA